MTKMKRQFGFTLIEILVAITLLIILMGLVFLPILSAYGYVQKVRDSIELRQNTNAVISDIKDNLSKAVKVYDIAPDGSSITFVIEDTSNPSRAILVRYMRSLNYPFNGDGEYAKVNFADVLDSEFRLSNLYSPYAKSFSRANPYMLGRYVNETSGNLDLYGDWLNFTPIIKDINYPINTINSGSDTKSFLSTKYASTLISMYPANIRYDVLNCTFTPMRVLNETLKMAKKNTNALDATYATAKYGGWAGRNSILDEIYAGQGKLALYNTFLASYYASDASITDENLAYDEFLSDEYRGNFYKLGANPFGYAIKIFDSRGDLVYGVRPDGTFVDNRHIVDWPKRELFGDNVGYVDGDSKYWTYRDVAKQREKGQVVFAQPIKFNKILISTDGTQGIFELPDSWKWTVNGTQYVPYEKTYLVSLDVNKIKIDGVDFVRVYKESNLDDTLTTGQFYLPNIGDTTHKSRIITFNRNIEDFGIILADIQLELTSDGHIVGFAAGEEVAAVICDVQPTDRVVANYSTTAKIDLALSVTKSSQKISASGGQEPVKHEVKQRVNVPRIKGSVR